MGTVGSVCICTSFTNCFSIALQLNRASLPPTLPFLFFVCVCVFCSRAALSVHFLGFFHVPKSACVPTRGTALKLCQVEGYMGVRLCACFSQGFQRLCSRAQTSNADGGRGGAATSQKKNDCAVEPLRK